MQIMGRESEIRVIGTRHGEKQYESLVSREEMARADDLGDYYRVPADNRDLNYKQYTDEGNLKTAALSDYTSDNTERLDVDGIVRLIESLPYIQAEIDELKARM